jgi:hypothetical protein
MMRKSLTFGGHENTVTVTDAGPEGWEVLEERDRQVVRRVHYTDWHRVERALMRFDAGILALPEPHSTNR